jgi:hypothetical protein
LHFCLQKSRLCIKLYEHRLHTTVHASVICYSILYADIVGFTAISSTYSASELVKILNELFARFDRLSEVSIKFKVPKMKVKFSVYLTKYHAMKT